MGKKKLIFYGVSIILAIVVLIFTVSFAKGIIIDEDDSTNNWSIDTTRESDTGESDKTVFDNLDDDMSTETSGSGIVDLVTENTFDENLDALEDIKDVSESENTSTDIKSIQDQGEDTEVSEISENSEDPEAPKNQVNLQSLNDSSKDDSNGVSLDIKEIEKEKEMHETDDITYGIDVAKWQGVIDWAKVKEAGVEFAMIRAGYRTLVDGKILEDVYAKYNLQQAKKHGIKIGVYFFSTAISEKEAKEEAKWVAEYIAPYNITYPVVFNCEGFTNPNNRQYGMTKEERSKLAITFLDYMKDKGYIPMFYAAKNELENSRDWDTDKLTGKYKIWVAQYIDSFDSDNIKSSYSGTHDMWQYTSNGSVPGIKGAVDFNIAYFGFKKEADAKENVTEQEVIADPAALINFKDVREKVTAKEITNLRDKPNLDSDSNVIYALEYGDIATRTGIGDNGWSRVEYEGKILYAVTSFLTTDLDFQENTKLTIEDPEAGITFLEVNEKVTAKIITNLRLVPSTDSDNTVVLALENGDIATRTGLGDNGWSRVEYDGQTLYAVTNYLEIVAEE